MRYTGYSYAHNLFTNGWTFVSGVIYEKMLETVASHHNLG